MIVQPPVHYESCRIIFKVKKYWGWGDFFIKSPQHLVETNIAKPMRISESILYRNNIRTHKSFQLVLCEISLTPAHEKNNSMMMIVVVC